MTLLPRKNSELFQWHAAPFRSPRGNDDEELSLRAASVPSGLCVFAAKPQAAVS